MVISCLVETDKILCDRRLIMRDWPWQKWIGKLLPFGVAVGAAVWTLVEKQPGWWAVGVAAATGIVQWLIATFPPKT